MKNGEEETIQSAIEPPPSLHPVLLPPPGSATRTSEDHTNCFIRHCAALTFVYFRPLLFLFVRIDFCLLRVCLARYRQLSNRCHLNLDGDLNLVEGAAPSPPTPPPALPPPLWWW